MTYGGDAKKQAAYIFAGLGMMLNIRLAYSSAPYALIRFQLPENLFSVFVRRMASALELWCLPGFLIVNLMDLIRKYGSGGTKLGDEKAWGYNYQCILCQWLNCLTFVILFFVYRAGGDQGRLTVYYLVIAISGFVFGLSNPLVYAVNYNYVPVYMAGENCFPMVTSLIHYITTLIFGNRRKYNSDYLIFCIDIWVAITISFVAAVLWTVVFNEYEPPFSGSDTPEIGVASPIAMVIVGMGLVYAIYPGIAPGMIVPFYLIDKIEMVLLIATAIPPLIVAILRETKNPWSPQHYVNHGKNRNGNGFYGWTEYTAHQGDPNNKDAEPAEACTASNQHVTVNTSFYHAFDILIVVKITLAGIFIYSLHYKESSISRAIINQPKMSTFLSITFYMCHEFLLALGFPGIIGNKGADYILIPQYIGALLMIFLAFYSEGYIIEYKSHDPAHWPTEGMTKWNAFCYWCKRASKITNHNLRSLFTTDLRRDLLLCIQKNELI